MANKKISDLSALAASDALAPDNLLAAWWAAGGAGVQTRSVRFDVLRGAINRLARVYDLADPVYGVLFDGSDESAKLATALADVGNGATLLIPAGKIISVASTVLHGQQVTICASGGGALAGQGTIKWIGGAGGTVLAPSNTGISGEGLRLLNVEIDGNALANVGLDLHHVSHSEIKNCYIHGCTSGANACGVRLYRDRDAGFACYYNRIIGGKISGNTIGIFITGTGAGSQTNCCNSNGCEWTDLLSNGWSVYYERGNDFMVLGGRSEAPTSGHFRTAGAGFHLAFTRVENSGATPALPGLQLDSTAVTTIEIGNYWATFTNDPVQDSSTAKDIQRFSTWGSGVNGGIAGIAQFPRAYLTELFSKPGSSLIDLNGGALGGTGKVRINRSTASADGSALEVYNGTGTKQGSVDSSGRFLSKALSETVQTLTDAGTVATDCTLGGYCKLSAGGSRTIAAPTNVVTQRLIYDILNNTAGAITTTWNAAFKLAGAWVDPAAGKRRVIEFIWDGSNWIEQRRSVADI